MNAQHGIMDVLSGNIFREEFFQVTVKIQMVVETKHHNNWRHLLNGIWYRRQPSMLLADAGSSEASLRPDGDKESASSGQSTNLLH